MSTYPHIKRVMLSGGGTGGHIFPAVAIADQIKALAPQVEIRFVGALGKMEMERVPKAGYPIDGLWISGIQRKLTLQNLLFPAKLLLSMLKARRLLKDFQPQLVIGTGGFASGPLLRVAARRGIPTLIQEQNAYAGLTNKWLASVVDRICVAYPGMERYFPAAKLLEIGNPVREQLLTKTKREAACQHYGFDPAKKVIFLTGGSLGARTLNEAMAKAHSWLQTNPQVQVLWQCGKFYESSYANSPTAQLPNVTMTAFVDRMDLAYRMADVVIARAGALTIAELCLLEKAAILVPSPNVAEDHQTKNALALSERDAAKLVRDAAADTELMTVAAALLENDDERNRLAANAKSMAYAAAAEKIAKQALMLVQ